MQLPEDILKFDESALYLYDLMHKLLSDHKAVWDNPSQNIGLDSLRLDEIQQELVRVIFDLANHIACVLLFKAPYELGTPGIRITDGLLIRMFMTGIHVRSATTEEERITEVIETIQELEVLG